MAERAKPPNNLQRQPLLALAVLAGRPGETLTMADLAEGMFELGGLRKMETISEKRGDSIAEGAIVPAPRRGRTIAASCSKEPW